VSFNLQKNISLRNMHAFDSQGVIKKYRSPEEIVVSNICIELVGKHNQCRAL
jgi:hypothetical protein